MLFANWVIQHLIRSLQLMSLMFNHYLMVDPFNLFNLMRLSNLWILVNSLLAKFLTPFKCNQINSSTFTKIICNLEVVWCLKYLCQSLKFQLKFLIFLDNNNKSQNCNLTKNSYLFNTFVKIDSKKHSISKTASRFWSWLIKIHIKSILTRNLMIRSFWAF